MFLAQTPQRVYRIKTSKWVDMHGQVLKPRRKYSEAQCHGKENVERAAMIRHATRPLAELEANALQDLVVTIA